MLERKLFIPCCVTPPPQVRIFILMQGTETARCVRGWKQSKRGWLSWKPPKWDPSPSEHGANKVATTSPPSFDRVIKLLTFLLIKLNMYDMPRLPCASYSYVNTEARLMASLWHYIKRNFMVYFGSFRAFFEFCTTVKSSGNVTRVWEKHRDLWWKAPHHTHTRYHTIKM
jgi:hypothetical protein